MLYEVITDAAAGAPPDEVAPMSRVVVNVREKCYPGSCGVALAVV